MPSNTPLTDAINALTTYANETTGQSDTTLSDAVGTLVAGYGGGGGGGPISLLDTLTVSADSRTYNLDLTPYASYDFVFVYGDVTLSAADWLYFVQNGSSPSGGSYTNQSRADQTGLVYERAKVMGLPNAKHLIPKADGFQVNETAATNVFIYCYVASKTIKAGSKFYVFGGNYADF